MALAIPAPFHSCPYQRRFPADHMEVKQEPEWADYVCEMVPGICTFEQV